MDTIQANSRKFAHSTAAPTGTVATDEPRGARKWDPPPESCSTITEAVAVMVKDTWDGRAPVTTAPTLVVPTATRRKAAAAIPSDRVRLQVVSGVRPAVSGPLSSAFL